MSQITRCPFCSTAFKVVADQLRISDGWVRCGQCKEVFDASEHLLPAEPPAPLLPGLLVGDAPAPQPPPAPAPRPPDEWLPSISVLLEREAPPQEPEGDEPPGAQWDDGPEESPAPPPQELQAEPEETLEAAPETAQEAASGEADDGGTEPPAESEPSTPDPDPAPPAEIAADEDGEPDDAPAPEPGFITAARRDAYWRRPAVRAALAGAGCVLAAVLGLQAAVQERDVIAARFPAARAPLQALCEPLGCVLQAPRRIAAVVIDSSSFVKARGDASGYRLQVSIKNTSALTIAMPALELTLTDAQEQTVLRRVLPPQELAAPPELAAGAVWSGAVSVQLAGAADPVAGYRLLAFYP